MSKLYKIQTAKAVHFWSKEQIDQAGGVEAARKLIEEAENPKPQKTRVIDKGEKPEEK